MILIEYGCKTKKYFLKNISQDKILSVNSSFTLTAPLLEYRLSFGIFPLFDIITKKRIFADRFKVTYIENDGYWNMLLISHA